MTHSLSSAQDMLKLLVCLCFTDVRDQLNPFLCWAKYLSFHQCLSAKLEDIWDIHTGMTGTIQNLWYTVLEQQLKARLEHCIVPDIPSAAEKQNQINLQNTATLIM